MNHYFTKAGKKLGRGYSLMRCDKWRDKEDHTPHQHNPEFVLYGPYFCAGFPEVEIYDTPPRKPVNPKK